MADSRSRLWDVAAAWTGIGRGGSDHFGYANTSPGGRGTDAGSYITPEASLAIQAYFSCLRCFSEDAGKLPIQLIRKTKERGYTVRQPADDDSRYFMLHDRVNPDLGATNFKETWLHLAAGWGGGVAEIEHDPRGFPVALWPIHSERVQMGRDDAGIFYRISPPSPDKPFRMLRGYDVLHLHGLSPTGLAGYNVSYLAANSIANLQEANRYAGRFFAEDAMPGVAIIKKGKVDPKAPDTAIFEAMWRAKFSGAVRSNKVAYIGDDMKIERIGIPPKEAQLFESREFEKNEIAGWFRMPAEFIGAESKSYLAPLEERIRAYWSLTIHPWVERMEEELNYKLLFPWERRDMEFKINMSAVLRGNPLDRANVSRTWYFMGKPVNRLLAQEDENGIGPEGDVSLVPSNLVSLTNLINGQAGDTSKNPTSGRPGKPVENTPDKDPNSPTQNDQGADEADTALAEAALDRVLAKEWRMIDRIARRAQSVNEFETAVRAAYQELTAMIIREIIPVLDLQSDPDPFHAQDRAAIFAERYAAERVRDLMKAWQNNGVEAVAEFLSRLRINGSTAQAVEVLKCA